MRKFSDRVTCFTLLLAIFLTACQAVPTLLPPTEPPSQSTSTKAATTTIKSTIEPTPTATNESPVYVYQPNPALPDAFNQLIETQNLVQPQGNPNEIVFTFEFSGSNPIGSWVYALVAPFPTVVEEVSSTWLQNLWQGQPEDAISTLIISEIDLPALSSILGEPGDSIQTLPKEQLLETAWTTQNTWAVIPFEEIQPRWKVITINGQSPIHKDFAADQYTLNVPVSAASVEEDEELSLPPEMTTLHFSNLDSNKITTVMLTGVTALVRATAVGMDQRGVLVPGENIATIMKRRTFCTSATKCRLTKTAHSIRQGVTWCSALLKITCNFSALWARISWN
jgi:poly-gamma-glutamate synthesis protein (capsule biosynthesis protein)